MSDDVAVDQAKDVVATEPAPEAVAEPVVSAGEQLAALRQARGWKTEQVANQLNLANRQIVALEADNYAALPGMAIVRGFIRSYAKVLHTDPAPILAAIVGDVAASSELSPERKTLSTSFSEVKLQPSNVRGFPLKTVVLLVILIMAVIVIFGAQRMGWAPIKSAVEVVKIEEVIPAETDPLETPEAVPEFAEPAVANDDQLSSPESVDLAEPIAVQKAALPATTNAVSTVAVTEAAPMAGKAPMPATAVAVNGKDALAIQVRQDAWVEIKRADNSVVLSRLLKAGTSEVVEIIEPVSMVIGNAAGVDVTLRGAPLDVVAGNSSNVARLNLK